jgi:diacylglycerol kinase family enzyme
VDGLVAAAAERGIESHVLREGDDLAALAALSRTRVLGIAGGDGSLAPVAQIAIERGLPFVCVPIGTRNHFARDVGVYGVDPRRALEAFVGDERRIDVGRAGDRLFLNNVSIGAYGSLVHRREEHRRRREMLAGLRALVRMPAHPLPLRLRVDGEPLPARVVLVANNAYQVRLFDLGGRPNLAEGRLHLYSAAGLLPTEWGERSGETFELDGPGVVEAAIDGEPVELRLPLTCRLEPKALRVLVPPGR